MQRKDILPLPAQPFPSQLAALSPEKRALLELRLKKQAAHVRGTQVISRRTNGNVAPLSFAQQRLWFLDQFAPHNPVYNVYRAWRLHGGLNVDALQTALDTIVARHDTLRTTFQVIDGQLLQVIAAVANVQLTIVDLRELSATEREEQSVRLALQEAQLPFDLTQGPLFRVRLVRLAAEDHVLLLTLHHMVADGWSIGVLHRELATLYEAFVVGRSSPLLPLPIQYSDYSLWQHEQLQGEALENQLTYWKLQLASLSLLELPTDRPRPAVPSYRGERVTFHVSALLTAQLKRLSRQEGTTLFMTLVAAVKVLLCRYTGQDDITVGTPIANREHTEIEPLIGMIVNTLVLRTDLRDDPSFRQLLGRVRTGALGAYAHQDLPFEKLLEELRPERDLSRNPLFQVSFTLQTTPDQALALSGLTITPFATGSVSPFDRGNGTAKFDLTVSMVETEGELRGMLEYGTDLFDRATITRMAGHLHTLLEGVVAHSERRVSELPLLSEGEQQQVLIEWNNAEKEYFQDKCVHQLFAEQVERTPDAVAVAHEGQQLTYRELDHRANQLAHYLQRLGVGPGVLVGLCVERSLEMVVATLGILKAGGAYVPLDPGYPHERLAFMLEDSRVAVLLTQARWLPQLQDSSPLVICLDADWAVITQESETTLISSVTAEHLAYVIYTSGSTGKPKGVQIPHRALSNLLQAVGQRPGLSSQDILLAVTTLAFDIAALELLLPLTVGARVVVASRAVTSDGPLLQQCLVTSGATVLQATPTTWRMLIDGGWQGNPQLKMLCGGEVLTRDLAQSLLPRGASLWNMYGPTETTIWSTLTRVVSVDTVPPIGRPLANTQIYILNPHLLPTPPGVPGELYIGGAGLARGYLNRPELTAEKFIPHPFSTTPGARLYKTGDRARYLPDGNIEFLGRVDHQVKLRGFRIELGEIETVLRQYTAIREAIVLVREDEPGDQRLVAYLVPEPTQTPTASALRTFAQTTLPDYMVPSVFVFLEALPLTPNGKIDRRALPVPESTRPELEQAFVVPRTPEEEIIANIWGQVLGLERVGVHDNFFELGGHSLKATQVVSRLRAALQLELPLRDLFANPTIAGLAERLEDSRRNEQRVSTPPLVSVQREDNLSLSFAQQRLWFLDQLDPESAVYNLPGALRLRGPLNVTALAQSLNEIVRRHEVLRTTFAMVNGTPVQLIAPALTLPLPISDLAERAEREREAEAERLVREDALQPFDLSRGPLVRAKVLRLGEHDHILILTLHHIVSDGWSTSVLYRELAALYQAFAHGRPSPLPELSLQYADYATWQRQWLQGEALEKQLSYWKQQLSGSLPVLELPTDRPRPAVQTFRGARESLLLPAAPSAALKALSQREGITLFMTLLAAFQTILYRYTGQGDIVVGAPIAGRTRVEVEGLVGFFVNTLVLRTDLSGNPTFRELLGRVREVALGAYAHQDLPFEKLVEELQPERDLSRAPLFQVFFNLLSAVDSEITLPGLTVTSLSSPEIGSKFDLTLYAIEQEEGIRLEFAYNTDLFDAVTVRWMLAHFQTCIASILTNPAQRLSALPLLTAAEWQQLSIRGNGVRPAKPFVQFTREGIEQSIQARFEQQVSQYPKHLAVKTKRYAWTYEELNRAANRVAQTILTLRGSGAERIALMCEPDAPMIAGLLGVLKAGKTYVPLDYSYPQERLAYLLKDSQAGVLLTNKVNLAFAKTLVRDGLQLINIDELELATGSDNIGLPTSPDTLAYLLYTSGSTGQPKGVMQSHRNVLHHISNYTNGLHISADDRLTLLSSYSFDAAVMDIFGAVLNGATLYPMNIQETGLANLPQRLIEHGITIYHSTPTVYRYFVSSLTGEEEFPRLRLIVLGGEEVYKSDVDLYKKSFPPECIFVNGLGPTESTVSLQYFVDKQTEITHNAVPVGYPVEGTEILFLTEAGEDAEIYGELAVRSPHVALGYWQKPELTRGVFLPDPQGGTRRIYRTGDMGRLRPDGSIEFLGRKDWQVKLRGFRIELGEIEAVLGQHSAVQQTVVLARAESSGDKRLVAYLVSGEPTVSVSELRSFLTTRLPEYMIPSVFVFLASLPLTPNGKIDRRALPLPEPTRPELEQAFIAPRTPEEEIIAGVWRDVLGLEYVGIHDNFFELGGHSLKATQVTARLRTALQIELPLRTLFEAPTVAGLVADITQSQEQSGARAQLAQLLTEVENLSEDEAEQALAQQR